MIRLGGRLVIVSTSQSSVSRRKLRGSLSACRGRATVGWPASLGDEGAFFCRRLPAASYGRSAATLAGLSAPRTDTGTQPQHSWASHRRTAPAHRKPGRLQCSAAGSSPPDTRLARRQRHATLQRHCSASPRDAPSGCSPANAALRFRREARARASGRRLQTPLMMRNQLRSKGEAAGVTRGARRRHLFLVARRPMCTASLSPRRRS